MATRIYWSPPNNGIVQTYEVYVADNTTLPLESVFVFGGEKSGPYYEASTNRFFYDDPTGTDQSIYRVLGYDLNGILFDTGIFQPDKSFAANLAARTKVDHNYGGVNALQAVASNGVGIPQATIRFFRKPDYDAGQTQLALFAIETNATGQFKTPVWLEPGMDYVLIYEKKNFYKNTKKEITV